MKQAIPWLTSAGTLFGMWLIGNKNWWGWIVGLLNQVLWVALAIAFATWGLLPLTACLIVLYARNLIRWRRLERDDPSQDSPGARPLPGGSYPSGHIARAETQPDEPSRSGHTAKSGHLSVAESVIRERDDMAYQCARLHAEGASIPFHIRQWESFNRGRQRYDDIIGSQR